MGRHKISWFSWNPDQLTFIGAMLAVLSIGASVLMNFSDSRLIGHVLRQIVQVMTFSVILPMFFLNRFRAFDDAGIRFDRPLRYLLISLGLAVLLVFQMGMDIGFDSFRIPSRTGIEGAVYVMITNIVEVIFFACFLRFAFERSFGAIPGIFLAAAAFSLHHAGFQPEFLKLFIVGLVFITIVRLAGHWLVAFPFWWVGGVVDVLYSSEATAAVDWSGYSIWAGIILFVILMSFILFYRPAGR